MDLGLVHKKRLSDAAVTSVITMLSHVTANDKRQDGGHRGVVFGLFVCW